MSGPKAKTKGGDVKDPMAQVLRVLIDPDHPRHKWLCGELDALAAKCGGEGLEEAPVQEPGA